MNVKYSLAMKTAMATTLSGVVLFGGAASAVAAPMDSAPVVTCISAEDKAQTVEGLKAMLAEATTSLEEARANVDVARRHVEEATRAHDAATRDAAKVAKDLEGKTRALEVARVAEAAAKKALDDAVEAEKAAMKAYEEYKKIDADAVNKEFEEASRVAEQAEQAKQALASAKQRASEATRDFRNLEALLGKQQKDAEAAKTTVQSLTNVIEEAGKELELGTAEALKTDVEEAERLLAESIAKFNEHPEDLRLKAAKEELERTLASAKYFYDRAVKAEATVREAGEALKRRGSRPTESMPTSK